MFFQYSYLLSLIRSGAGVCLSRIFGLARDIVVAAVYGATFVTDIFFVAFAIPNLFRQFFAEGAISSAYVPILSDKNKYGKKAACTYLTQLIVAQTLLVTIVCIIIALSASFLIILFMPGVADDPYSIFLGTGLLRIVAPYLLFISIAGMFAGYLNLAGSYFVAYSSTAILNIMMIIGAAVGCYYGGNIFPLALSVSLGGICQVLLVAFYARYKGFRLECIYPFDPDVKRTYKLVIPSIAGVGISQLNFLIGRIAASFLQAGSISWLFYANRLFQFPLGIFSVTISTVSLTELSKARSEEDIAYAGMLIDRAVLLILLVILPSAIGLIGLAEELVTLIYRRSSFTATDVLMSAGALRMYAAGLLFYSLSSVFTRVFHSQKNTKTPVKIAIVSFLVNFLFILLFVKNLGHYGIALASSVAAFVNAGMLYFSLVDYRFSLRNNAKTIAKILGANYFLLAAMVAMKTFNAPVLINVFVSALVYFMILWLFKFNYRGLFSGKTKHEC
jgi:putative peptidoglycan lipid II flippase